MKYKIQTYNIDYNDSTAMSYSELDDALELLTRLFPNVEIDISFSGED